MASTIKLLFLFVVINTVTAHIQHSSKDDKIDNMLDKCHSYIIEPFINSLEHLKDSNALKPARNLKKLDIKCIVDHVLDFLKCVFDGEFVDNHFKWNQTNLIACASKLIALTECFTQTD